MKEYPGIKEVKLIGGIIRIVVQWGNLLYNYSIDSSSIGSGIREVINDEEPLFFTVVKSDGSTKTISLFVPDEDIHIDFYDFDSIRYINGEKVNFTYMYEFH